MCGIFGYCDPDLGRTVGPDLLRSMGAILRHRGPDDEGFFLDGPVGLGMRRLSIIDLKTGRQPIQNEDGSLQIVFNGEIYNYQALMQELLARGHIFSTTADTEVILHLYEELGTECLHRLRGMFALALWDVKAQTLFLARDRLGIKPLYYAPISGSTGSGLVFASELKALLRVPGIGREVDPEALRAYLQLGYVPEPLSILRDVQKLPAGHWLRRRSDGPIEVRPYWDPAPFFEHASPPPTEEDLVDELRRHLQEAIRLHLVSDVPVGAFLSGGIDSSAVVAMMAAELGGSVKTFSIGFPEDGVSELPYARAVARHFGTDHHELVVEPGSVDLLERLAGHFDEPFADPSAIPTYFVSQLAGQHVKVVLSGDGGDELFAGYDRYVTDHHRRWWDVISRTGVSPLVRRVSEALPETAPGKYFLFNVTLPRVERYLDGVSHFPRRLLPRLLARDLATIPDRAGSGAIAPHLARGERLGFPDRLQYLDLKTYLPGDILTKVDRMSMAHSLEARVPILDHRLVEFVSGIPSSLKLRNGATKHVFKRAIEPLLPAEVLSRGKQGFGIPLQQWFGRGLERQLRERLLGADALRHGYFDRDFVAAHFGWYERTGRGAYLDRLWTVLVFELWHRAVVDRHA